MAGGLLLLLEAGGGGRLLFFMREACLGGKQSDYQHYGRVRHRVRRAKVSQQCWRAPPSHVQHGCFFVVRALRFCVFVCVCVSCCCHPSECAMTIRSPLADFEERRDLSSYPLPSKPGLLSATPSQGLNTAGLTDVHSPPLASSLATSLLSCCWCEYIRSLCPASPLAHRLPANSPVGVFLCNGRPLPTVPPAADGAGSGRG